jgi:hypothetical protein
MKGEEEARVLSGLPRLRGQIFPKKALFLANVMNLSKLLPVARLTAESVRGRASPDTAAVPFCSRRYDQVFCVGRTSRSLARRRG